MTAPDITPEVLDNLRARLADTVLVEARRYLNVQEAPPGSNRGTEVDYWVREAKLDPKGAYPWCAAFVGAVGRQAIGTLLWRAPRTASVAQLAEWAKQHQVLVESPERGDLFLLWEAQLTPPRFGHVGFVDAVAPDHMLTLEGNTNPGGGREGFGVFARRRNLAPTTRYVRWVRTVPRGTL